MDRYLRIGDAAQQMGVSVDTMRRWANEGVITAYRSPGGQVKLRERDVQQLLSRREEPKHVGRTDHGSDPNSRVHSLNTPRVSPVQDWRELPPWEQRRAEAEADVAIERLSVVREQERLHEDRSAREDAARAAESARLTKLKRLGRLSCWLSDATDEVIRDLERYVTSEQFPPWLSEWESAMMIQQFVWRVCDRVRDAKQTREQKP